MKNRFGGNSGPDNPNIKRQMESILASQANQQAVVHQQATAGKEQRFCPACGSHLFAFAYGCPLWADAIIGQNQPEVYPPAGPDFSIAICRNPDCQHEWVLGEMVKMEESRERYWKDKNPAKPPFFVKEGRHMKVAKEARERMDALEARIKKLEDTIE